MFVGDMMFMSYRMDREAQARRAGLRTPGLCLLLIGALAAGCAGPEKREPPGPPGAAGRVPAPKPPPFLGGAMALLLTNAGGFRAHAVLTGGAAAEPGGVLAGELIGWGGKLLFAAEPGGKGPKHGRVEDFSFIWDVDAGRGFLLNGPLQGYAPIAAKTQFTNLVVSAARASAAPQQVAGHPCQESEVQVTSSDGTATVLHAWRATDLQGLPLRITCATAGTPLTLSLSKVRRETPPNDLFLPPDGFTKYTSAEALMLELMARRDSLKRRPEYQHPPGETPGAMDNSMPSR
jgi:hypothetical protein